MLTASDVVGYVRKVFTRDCTLIPCYGPAGRGAVAGRRGQVARPVAGSSGRTPITAPDHQISAPKSTRFSLNAWHRQLHTQTHTCTHRMNPSRYHHMRMYGCTISLTYTRTPYTNIQDQIRIVVILIEY